MDLAGEGEGLRLMREARVMNLVSQAGNSRLSKEIRKRIGGFLKQSFCELVQRGEICRSGHDFVSGRSE